MRGRSGAVPREKVGAVPSARVEAGRCDERRAPEGAVASTCARGTGGGGTEPKYGTDPDALRAEVRKAEAAEEVER